MKHLDEVVLAEQSHMMWLLVALIIAMLFLLIGLSASSYFLWLRRKQRGSSKRRGPFLPETLGPGTPFEALPSNLKAIKTTSDSREPLLTEVPVQSTTNQ